MSLKGRVKRKLRGHGNIRPLGYSSEKKPSQNHQVRSALHVLIPGSAFSPQAGEAQC